MTIMGQCRALPRRGTRGWLGRGAGVVSPRRANQRDGTLDAAPALASRPEGTTASHVPGLLEIHRLKAPEGIQIQKAYIPSSKSIQVKKHREALAVALPAVAATTPGSTTTCEEALSPHRQPRQDEVLCLKTKHWPLSSTGPHADSFHIWKTTPEIVLVEGM